MGARTNLIKSAKSCKLMPASNPTGIRETPIDFNSTSSRLDDKLRNDEETDSFPSSIRPATSVGTKLAKNLSRSETPAGSFRIPGFKPEAQALDPLTH